MRLKNVFVRFYKSFNFDYLRKYNSNASAGHPWEQVNELWYPYIRVPIDPRITTVVGANESGKTHLLTAIEKGLSGQGIARDDFCRYSHFFAVEQDTMRWPDFGFEWAGLTRHESETVAAACEALNVAFDNILLFRTDREELTVYVRTPGGFSRHRVTDPMRLQSVLPHVFRLQENVALPQNVPIQFLAEDSIAAHGFAALPRPKRVDLFNSFLSNPSWFQTKDTVTQAAEPIARTLGTFASTSVDDPKSARRRTAEWNLARDLIRKVARIDAEALKELHTALRDGRDAFANSIIAEINDQLQAKLNFPNWWVQDREFRLLVSPRDYDLVFTIRDRTETEYAFSERSSGLRYFLSYYIQYLAHERLADRPEILLMDEPDAYLMVLQEFPGW